MFPTAIMRGCSAGVAQLVERNLAKVEVESSRLFSRSKSLGESCCFPPFSLRPPPRRSGAVSQDKSFAARWQSGYAAACKAVYLGSIPGRASNITKPLGDSTSYHFSGNGEKPFAITGENRSPTRVRTYSRVMFSVVCPDSFLA